MIRTIEATVDEKGRVQLLESVQLPGARRALVTIFEDEPALHPRATALASEAVLAVDWGRPEEDAAWAHLQQGRSS